MIHTYSHAPKYIVIAFCVVGTLIHAQNKEVEEARILNPWVKITDNGVVPIAKTADNKLFIPQAASQLSDTSRASYLRHKTFVRHPKGSVLFPNNAGVAGLLDDFIQSIEDDAQKKLQEKQKHDRDDLKKKTDDQLRAEAQDVIKAKYTCENNDKCDAEKIFGQRQDALDELEKKTGAQLRAAVEEQIKSYQPHSYFLVYFNKLHFVILHELYKYLLKIYTVCNLSHLDKLDEYIAANNQALNKKTLIVNHLINVIEEQLNSAIMARWPGLPKHIATQAGGTLMKNDYGTALEILIDNQELEIFGEILKDSPQDQKDFVYGTIRGVRNDYLNLFGKYLKLFSVYAEPLYDAKGTADVDTFIKNATGVQKSMSQIFNATQDKLTGKTAQQKATLLRTEIKDINPPLFFADKETLRALNIIPTIAQSLPKKAEKFPKPKTIIEKAKSGERLKNGSDYPVAFFLTSDNKPTSSPTDRLFVNIATANHVYMQELLEQPEWLNSTEGVMRMLRACVGDFSALAHPIFAQDKILDACIMCILADAAKRGGVGNIAPKNYCAECKTYLKEIRAYVKKEGSTLPQEEPQNNDSNYIPPTDTSGGVPR